MIHLSRVRACTALVRNRERRVSPRLAGVIPGQGLEMSAALRTVRTRIVRAGGTEGSGEGVAAGTRVAGGGNESHCVCKTTPGSGSCLERAEWLTVCWCVLWCTADS